MPEKFWMLKFKVEAEYEDYMCDWHTTRKEVSIPLLATNEKEARKQMGLYRKRFSYDNLPSDIKAHIPEDASLIFSDWRVVCE